VTEGAIPFAAADPIRVIPSLIAGSATAGALCVALGAGTSAPHGGILVFALAARPLALVVAVAAGVLVSAAAVLALKALRRRAATAPASPP
jgi:fructose PTS system EIIBC or EIIC component